MTASTRLTLFLARSTKFLHEMICSSKGRTLALERAIRRASTKGFPSGFPSPNAERGLLANDAPLRWPLRKLCREGDWGLAEVGRPKLISAVVWRNLQRLTDCAWNFLDALLAGQLWGPLVRLGPRTSNDLHPTVQNWCSLSSSRDCVDTYSQKVPWGHNTKQKSNTKTRPDGPRTSNGRLEIVP